MPSDKKRIFLELDRWMGLIHRQGNIWNHKRVHRIYCLLKLNFRRKGKQLLPLHNPAPLATPEALNQVGR